MICQTCGLQGPTMPVKFFQNIGALVIRFHKSVRGNLCKGCINKYFRQFTVTTLFLGWWGIISFIVTPIFLCINLYYFFTTRSLPDGGMMPPMAGSGGPPPLITPR